MLLLKVEGTSKRARLEVEVDIFNLLLTARAVRSVSTLDIVDMRRLMTRVG
jgi:hypothetical protein